MSQHAMRLREVEELLSSGRAAEAAALCRRLAQAAPRDVATQHLMSNALLSSGQPTQALHYAQVASALAPGDVGLMLQHANLLLIGGKAEKALEVLAKAIKASPEAAAAHSMRASALLDLNRCVAALEASREACRLAPGDAGATAQFASCLLNAGRAEEAVAVMLPLVSNEAQAQPEMLSGMALLSNYHPAWSRADQHAMHAAYGRSLERRFGPAPARTFRARGQRLRVGVVSPDLRSHSVAWFIEPFFKHHDRARFEVHVYQTNAIADAVTQRLKPLTHAWRVMDNISDAGLAEVIFGDGIDVLLDLSGHTHAHSLACFHLRPAPVQLTYLGYPNVTGVRSMDGRIVDEVTDPPGCEAACVDSCERLVRMKRVFLCYEPPKGCKEAGPSPCASGAGVTFGSFNNAQKLSGATISLWSRLLRETLGSRLLLKGVAFAEDALRRDVLARFAAEGATNVEILPRAASTAEHLALYDRIDVGLDPIPYNGTTTTCEALWMGVPVVTLAGSTHAGRVGASLLTAVGLEELVAADEAGYVATAQRLAADVPRLAGLRAGLRARVAGSPLCDGPGWCREFERVLGG